MSCVIRLASRVISRIGSIEPGGVSCGLAVTAGSGAYYG